MLKGHLVNGWIYMEVDRIKKEDALQWVFQEVIICLQFIISEKKWFSDDIFLNHLQQPEFMTSWLFMLGAQSTRGKSRNIKCMKQRNTICRNPEILFGCRGCIWHEEASPAIPPAQHRDLPFKSIHRQIKYSVSKTFVSLFLRIPWLQFSLCNWF